MLPAAIQLEDARDNRGLCRINFDQTGCGIIAIAEWSTTGIKTLLGLFPHPLFHFFFQVLHVVLGDRDMDVMHEFVL